MNLQAKFAKTISNLILQILSVIISLPLFIICFLPLHISRAIAFALPKPNRFYRFLNPGDRYWAAFCYENPPYGTLLIEGIQEGHTDLDCFKAALQNEVKKHPELGCYLDTILGYPYFLFEENFSLMEHVFQEDCNSVGDFSKFRETLITTPFPLKKSPWTFHVVHVDREGKGLFTHFFLRIHHVLGDGYSLIGLLLNEEKTKRPTFSLTGWRKRLIQLKSILTTFPLTQSFPIWDKIFDPKASVFLVQASDSLDLQLLKGIRKKYGVTFAAIPQTAFTAAIRNHLLKKEITLPNTLTSAIPSPPPEPVGNGMSNAFGTIVLSLPLHFESLETLLFQVNDQILRKSLESVTGYYRRAFTGSVLPLPIIRRIGHIPVFAMASDFPGPEQRVKVCGKECQELLFFAQVFATKLGVTFTSLSYNGRWRPCLTVSKDLCGTRTEAQWLVDSIVEFIRKLANE